MILLGVVFVRQWLRRVRRRKIVGRISVPEGTKFGKLKVIKEVETLRHNNINYRQFELICECGNICIKKLSNLRARDTNSCGCDQYKGNPKDITGKKINNLTAIKRLEKSSNGDFYWEFLCDCGNTTKLTIGNFNFGHTKSCGCIGAAHPFSQTPTHQSWRKMQDRTRYEEYEEWHGDVTVCDRWDTRKGGSFDNFFEDMGERPEGTSLNRINGSKIYSKETCEWATYSLQSYDQKRHKDNTSGKTGVRFRKDRGKWTARISYQNKNISLGCYETFEDAVKARQEAELKYYGFTKE
jgi:hypothetical protein